MDSASLSALLTPMLLHTRMEVLLVEVVLASWDLSLLMANACQDQVQQLQLLLLKLLPLLKLYLELITLQVQILHLQVLQVQAKAVQV